MARLGRGLISRWSVSAISTLHGTVRQAMRPNRSRLVGGGRPGGGRHPDTMGTQASLAALLMLSRSGGTLFWRARGDHSDGKRVQPTQIAAVAILVITLPTMVIFAGWITEYAQLAASEMTRGVDLSLLGGDDA